MKTQPIFHEFSTICFSAGVQSSNVGEIIMWLTRDYMLQFYARSFPTYFSHHDDANTKARHFLSPLSTERVFAALIFAARVNNRSADTPFP